MISSFRRNEFHCHGGFSLLVVRICKVRCLSLSGRQSAFTVILTARVILVLMGIGPGPGTSFGLFTITPVFTSIIAGFLSSTIPNPIFIMTKIILLTHFDLFICWTIFSI
jgi:hypothetical protein